MASDKVDQRGLVPKLRRSLAGSARILRARWWSLLGPRAGWKPALRDFVIAMRRVWCDVFERQPSNYNRSTSTKNAPRAFSSPNENQVCNRALQLGHRSAPRLESDPGQDITQHGLIEGRLDRDVLSDRSRGLPSCDCRFGPGSGVGRSWNSPAGEVISRSPESRCSSTSMRASARSTHMSA